MPRLIVALPALVLLLAAPACVSRGKYQDLEGHLDANQRALGEREIQMTAMAAELDAAKEKIDLLQAELADSRDEAATLAAQLARGDAELATLLKDRSRLKDSVQDMSLALAQQRKRQIETEKRIAEYRDMLLRFRALIDAGKLNVQIDDGRMVLALPTDILFATGSSRLSDDGKKAIQEVGKILATFTDKEFQIEGHTDDVPISTDTYPSNWELASARAITVVKSLETAGVSPKQLSAASFGEYKPEVENTDERARTQNRRIEIVILPDLSNLPGYDELNTLATK